MREAKKGKFANFLSMEHEKMFTKMNDDANWCKNVSTNDGKTHKNLANNLQSQIGTMDFLETNFFSLP